VNVRIASASLLATLFFAPACIDDPAAISGDPLPISAAEARILGVSVWRDIMVQGTTALDDATNVNDLVEFVRRSDDSSVDQRLLLDQECEYGGDVIVDGRVLGEADAAGNGFVEVAITQSWEECAVMFDDLRAVLIGDPNVDSNVRYDFAADGSMDIEGRMEGTIVVQLPDGRSGPCVYSVTFTGAESPEGRLVFRKKGLVCNEAVNERVVL
jgi:hypothetical protein